MFQIKLK